VTQIESILQELRDLSNQYNKKEISKDELNISLDLLVKRLENVKINYSIRPLSFLSETVAKIFNQRLIQVRNKAIEAINMLKKTDNRKSYNAKVRYLIDRKLYFGQLHHQIVKNIMSYESIISIEHLKLTGDIFIIGGGTDEQGQN
jgi:hypothetical protein